DGDGGVVDLQGPAALDEGENDVADGGVASGAAAAVEVDAVVVDLPAGVAGGVAAAAFAGCESSDVVDVVAFDGDVVDLDEDADLAVVGGGADLADVVDVVADDL